MYCKKMMWHGDIFLGHYFYYIYKFLSKIYPNLRNVQARMLHIPTFWLCPTSHMATFPFYMYKQLGMFLRQATSQLYINADILPVFYFV